jgi:AcrR family transcriptional regulator
MTQFSERVAERSVAAVRERATDEVGRLVASGLAVLRRSGVAGLTVNDVLAEAGLSTRAFYRHFASKNELVLAVFEHDSSRSNSRLADAVANAETARAAFEAWLDENLALVFEPRRARRTRTLWLEGSRLRNEFPQEFDAIVAWDLVERHLGGAQKLDRDEVRAHVLRFCLPALGAKP